MPLIFTTFDGLGREVDLEENRELGHILDEHEYLEDRVDEIRRVIKETFPPYIFQDTDFTENEVYYRLDESKQYYLKVVVDFSNEKRGTIVTAYETDSMKVGERIKWKLSSG